MKRLRNLLLILIVGVLISAAIIYIVFIAYIQAQQGNDSLATFFVYLILGLFIIGGLYRIIRLFRSPASAISEQVIKGNPEDAKTLVRANLRKVNLAGSKLDGKLLNYANLQDANLADANLRGVEAYGTIFFRANLMNADFTGADLSVADLRRSQLDRADLRGAILNSAFLRDATCVETRFDTNTKLPDGTMWKPDVDLGRFTDPKHSEFWEPNFDPRDPRR